MTILVSNGHFLTFTNFSFTNRAFLVSLTFQSPRTSVLILEQPKKKKKFRMGVTQVGNRKADSVAH